MSYDLKYVSLFKDKALLRIENQRISGIEKLAQEVVYNLINSAIFTQFKQYNIGNEEEFISFFSVVLDSIKRAIIENQKGQGLPDDERLEDLRILNWKAEQNEIIISVEVISVKGTKKELEIIA